MLLLMLKDMFTLRIHPNLLTCGYCLTNSRIVENDMRELKISSNLGLIKLLRSDKSREKTYMRFNYNL